MPGLLSLLLTVVIYWILKKTNGKYAATMILATMGICIGLVYAGILG
ncbi:TPA: PTS system mannose/fructose/sorbose family transporter subunit IID, partial [Mannheimia haemolytica]|nr:PTS system mannose/fructose/sorbose family transporter subunit IID [Mannheimia haemolytica]